MIFDEKSWPFASVVSVQAMDDQSAPRAAAYRLTEYRRALSRSQYWASQNAPAVRDVPVVRSRSRPWSGRAVFAHCAGEIAAGSVLAVQHCLEGVHLRSCEDVRASKQTGRALAPVPVRYPAGCLGYSMG